jgi:hypothetical protein
MNDCDQLPFNSKVLQEKSRAFRFCWMNYLHQPMDEADLSARSSGDTLPYLLFVHTSLQHFSPQLLFIYCFSCTTQSPSAHSWPTSFIYVIPPPLAQLLQCYLLSGWKSPNLLPWMNPWAMTEVKLEHENGTSPHAIMLEEDGPGVSKSSSGGAPTSQIHA